MQNKIFIASFQYINQTLQHYNSGSIIKFGKRFKRKKKHGEFVKKQFRKATASEY